jgi:hypothetical protein
VTERRGFLAKVKIVNLEQHFVRNKMSQNQLLQKLHYHDTADVQVLWYANKISLPLALHCKNLPINGLFSSMVVAAPFSDAGGHAQRKNRERRAEICTISQAFETLKESPACIGTLIERHDIRTFAKIRIATFRPERNASQATSAKTPISRRNGCADLTVYE